MYDVIFMAVILTEVSADGDDHRHAEERKADDFEPVSNRCHVRGRRDRR